jgi:hypothetical protein
LVYLFSFALILFHRGIWLKTWTAGYRPFFYMPFSQQSKAIEPLADAA